MQQRPDEEFAEGAHNDSDEDSGLHFTQKPPGCIQTLVGYNVILRCSAEGYAQPVITWKGKRTYLVTEENGHYEQLADGSLKISAVRKSDRGFFTCQASIGDDIINSVVHLCVVTMNQVCGSTDWEDAVDNEGREGSRVRRVVDGQPISIQSWPWQVR